MLFHLYQINGKRHCNNTRIARVTQEEFITAEDGVFEMSSHACSPKHHRQQLMQYEGLEGPSHFMEGDSNHCSL